MVEAAATGNSTSLCLFSSTHPCKKKNNTKTCSKQRTKGFQATTLRSAVAQKSAIFILNQAHHHFRLAWGQRLYWPACSFNKKY